MVDPDWTLLEQVLDAYQAALDAVQTKLEALGYSPTSRVKSTGTLVDKLRRGTTFKTVADVAGARLVVPAGRRDQDEVVSRLTAAFADTDPSRPPRVKDRRAEPSHGYRAVHVVIHYDGLPVEIQVRTSLQDVWAQIVERLGDTWGRELRYGEPIRDAVRPVFPHAPMNRQEFLEQVMMASSIIDTVEEVEGRTAARGEVGPVVPSAEPEPEPEPDTVPLSEVRTLLTDWLDNLGSLVDRMEDTG